MNVYGLERASRTIHIVGEGYLVLVKRGALRASLTPLYIPILVLLLDYGSRPFRYIAASTSMPSIHGHSSLAAYEPQVVHLLRS
jgi:hypothetical protein